MQTKNVFLLGIVLVVVIFILNFHKHENLIFTFFKDIGERQENSYYGCASLMYGDDTDTIANMGCGYTLWDINSGIKLHSIEEMHGTAVSLSPDGNTIVGLVEYSDNDGAGIGIWDVKTGALLHTLIDFYDSSITQLVYSPDGNTIVNGDGLGRMYLWDINNGNMQSMRIRGHFGSVNALVYSPDSTFIVSGSDDGTIKLWDAESGALLRTFHVPNLVYLLAFSPDGTTLAVGLGYKIQFWDTKSLTVVQTIKSNTFIDSLAFSPDSTMLAGGSEKKVILWDVKSGKVLQTLKGHTDSVDSVVFSSDGTGIASISSESDDGVIKIWRVSNSWD